MGGSSDVQSVADATKATPRELAEIVQKIYLGVGSVVSSDEARRILNDAGADLPASFQSASNADARTVMGRLGRVSDVASIDPQALTEGVGPAVAAIVAAVLAVTGAADMKTLRAEMVAALTEGVTDA